VDKDPSSLPVHQATADDQTATRCFRSASIARTWPRQPTEGKGGRRQATRGLTSRCRAQSNLNSLDTSTARHSR